MTPGARISAAIEILDLIQAGGAAEQVLTSWARGHRFAGSGDRAAIRDHVYDALRCLRSFGALGGCLDGKATGRQLMIGSLRVAGEDPIRLFDGQGYGPAPLNPQECSVAGGPVDHAALAEAVALDCPDWLVAPLKASLGDAFQPVMEQMRHRAPVFLRVNLARGDLARAVAELADDGIVAQPHPLATTALELIRNTQRVRASRAYQSGLVELQDAASQAAVALLPQVTGGRVLDYCAGGGGKALAMAARGIGQVYVHDVAPQRMRDIPVRAKRAGARLRSVEGPVPASDQPFDLVLADVPCSGSGTWRRAPDAKWRLTPARLQELTDLQQQILHDIKPLVAVGGHLAYMTCSILAEENDGQIARFLEQSPDWKCSLSRSFSPTEGGDGFFFALLSRV